MENTWVGWKKSLEIFFGWYICSGAGLIITIFLVFILSMAGTASVLDKRAEIVGHPAYTSKKMNIWIPQGAILGNFIEGGLSFHQATFSEMMENEKKFPNHFIKCDTISSNNDNVTCDYYAKSDNATHAYKATFVAEKHNNSNGWWTFKTKEIEMKDGFLFEKGRWEHGYMYMIFGWSSVIIFVATAICLFFKGQALWKKR